MELGLAACAPAGAAEARPDLPALSIQGIGRVAILCLAVDRTVERLRWQRHLCEQVHALALVGAPVPVAVIGFGDPVLTECDVLGVLVHASIDRSGPHPLAILSVRPHRAGANASVLFGATPVAVPLGPDGAVPDAAIAAALDQVLPWRMRAGG